MLVRTPATLARFVVRIGTCPTCVRQAFLAAATAWCSCLPAAIMASIFNLPIVVVASLTIAALLTGLWVAHITAFGLRAALHATAKPTGGPGAERDSARRSFLGVMATAVGGIAIATIVPGGPAFPADPKTLKIVVRRGTSKYRELLARGSIGVDNNPDHKVWCCAETCCDESCKLICEVECHWCG